MAVFNIRLDDDLYEWLRGEAFRRRTSMSRIIREALIALLAADDERASE